MQAGVRVNCRTRGAHAGGLTVDAPSGILIESFIVGPSAAGADPRQRGGTRDLTASRTRPVALPWRRRLAGRRRRPRGVAPMADGTLCFMSLSELAQRIRKREVSPV